MEVMEAIIKRKSVRKFSEKEVDRKYVEEILCYGMQAPSPKNDQPWYFYVVQAKEKKNRIADILDRSLKELKKENEKQGILREDIEGAFESVDILRTASVLIFVFLDNCVYSAHDDGVRWELAAKDVECTHIQAIGAAIQNMLLAAVSMGIDSLWLGDIFYAYSQILDFFGEKGIMMAAVALGYGLQNEEKTSRKCLKEKVKWMV